MAAPPLVDADMKLGAEAAAVLWKDPILQPTAIMWAYDEDASEWRFLVGSADARHRGPQATYRRIHKLLKHANMIDRFPLRRIVVVDPSSPSAYDFFSEGITTAGRW